MDPITAGAIALITLLVNKTFEKTGEIVVSKAFDQAGNVLNLLKHKSPETAKMIAAAENPALPPGETVYMDAVVEKVQSEAQRDPEIKAELEKLGAMIEAAKKVDPQLANTINENWQGICFKNANPTISNNTFNFGGKG